jgi:two-component system chemotaxis response regulator CheY
MRILIAEDDSIGRRLLQKYLSNYGECDIAIDGLEAIDSFLVGINENKRYDLICLDIMMPKLDGIKVLRAIRDIEKQKGLTDEERSNILKELAYDYKFYKRLFKIIYNKPQLRYDVASILCKIEKDYSFYK